MINPTETFRDIMIDYQYVECTSAAIQGLKAFTSKHPEHRTKQIQACIAKAVGFIRSIQQPDGSWSLISLYIYLILMHLLISSLIR